MLLRNCKIPSTLPQYCCEIVKPLQPSYNIASNIVALCPHPVTMLLGNCNMPPASPQYCCRIVIQFLCIYNIHSNIVAPTPKLITMLLKNCKLPSMSPQYCCVIVKLLQPSYNIPSNIVVLTTDVITMLLRNCKTIPAHLQYFQQHCSPNSQAATMLLRNCKFPSMLPQYCCVIAIQFWLTCNIASNIVALTPNVNIMLLRNCNRPPTLPQYSQNCKSARSIYSLSSRSSTPMYSSSLLMMVSCLHEKLCIRSWWRLCSSFPSTKMPGSLRTFSHNYQGNF